MIILIDAYNLLKTVLHVQFISQHQKLQFLHLFENYAYMRPHNQVILIFDGGSDVYEFEESHKHVTLIYAGGMQSADDVIKKKITILQGYDVLLVTCDRELRKYAAQRQVESLGSVEFYKIIQEIVNYQAKQKTIIAQTICKTSEDQNPDIDDLMELGSRRLIQKEQDKEIKINSFFTAQQSNKKDKKLLKKIVKI